MARYRYRAVGATGELEEGVLEAASQDAAIERLQGQGLIPIRAAEDAGSEAPAAAAPARPARKLFAPRRVTQQDVAVFTRELAALLKAGVPLDRALKMLADLAENPRLRELLGAVRDEVRGGAPLSRALGAQRGAFTRFYASMVRAGEAGGALAEVLERLAGHLERARELRDSVASALVYPVILAAAAALSILVLMLFVVPQFEQIFAQAGGTLPFATRVVLFAAEALRGYWPLLLGAVALTAWGVARSLADPAGRRRWDARLLRAPLVGDLVLKAETARFARTLATLAKNGVPLLAGLAIARDTMGNTLVAEAVERVAAEMKEGRGLARPMSETRRFPKLAVQMIAVGEESGRLDEMLARVADTYDAEVRLAVRRLVALVEPALIVAMALVIGGVILSLLVAMTSLFSLPF